MKHFPPKYVLFCDLEAICPSIEIWATSSLVDVKFHLQIKIKCHFGYILLV